MRYVVLVLLALAAWRLLRRPTERPRPWVEPYMDMEWQPQ